MIEYFLLNSLENSEVLFIRTPPSFIELPPTSFIEDKSIEPIDVIETWGLGYHLARVVNCLSQAGKKGRTLKDLKKAEWHLNRKIMSLSKTFKQCYPEEDDDPLTPQKIGENWQLSPNLSLALEHVLTMKQEDSSIDQLFKILRLLRLEIRSLLKQDT